MCKTFTEEEKPVRIDTHKLTVDFEDVIHYDHLHVPIIIHGISKVVRVGCTEVYFEAMERLYAIYRRHRDAIRFAAQ